MAADDDGAGPLPEGTQTLYDVFIVSPEDDFAMVRYAESPTTYAPLRVFQHGTSSDDSLPRRHADVRERREHGLNVADIAALSRIVYVLVSKHTLASTDVVATLQALVERDPSARPLLVPVFVGSDAPKLAGIAWDDYVAILATYAQLNSSSTVGADELRARAAVLVLFFAAAEPGPLTVAASNSSHALATALKNDAAARLGVALVNPHAARSYAAPRPVSSATRSALPAPSIANHVWVRSELTDVVNMLELGHSVGICGLGGCGKTALAVSLVSDPRVVGRLFNRVCWVEFGDGKTDEADVIALFKRIFSNGLGGAAHATFGSVAQAVATVQAKLMVLERDGERVLLAIDNVGSPIVAAVLANLVAPPHALLTTARRASWLPPDVTRVRLGPLSLSDARALFAVSLPHPLADRVDTLHDPRVATVLDRCHRHAAAIAAMGNDTSFLMLNTLANHPNEFDKCLVHAARDAFPVGYGSTEREPVVRFSDAFAAALLSLGHAEPHARAALVAAACFAPGTALTPPDVAPFTAATGFDVAAGLDALVDAGLADGGNGTPVVVHTPTTALVAATMMPSADVAAYLALSALAGHVPMFDVQSVATVTVRRQDVDACVADVVAQFARGRACAFVREHGVDVLVRAGAAEAARAVLCDWTYAREWLDGGEREVAAARAAARVGAAELAVRFGRGAAAFCAVAGREPEYASVVRGVVGESGRGVVYAGDVANDMVVGERRAVGDAVEMRIRTMVCTVPGRALGFTTSGGAVHVDLASGEVLEVLKRGHRGPVVGVVVVDPALAGAGGAADNERATVLSWGVERVVRVWRSVGSAPRGGGRRMYSCTDVDSGLVFPHPVAGVRAVGQSGAHVLPTIVVWADKGPLCVWAPVATRSSMAPFKYSDLPTEMLVGRRGGAGSWSTVAVVPGERGGDLGVLVAGDVGGRVYVWVPDARGVYGCSSEDGTASFVLEGHAGPVTGVGAAVSSVVSTGADGIVSVWDESGGARVFDAHNGRVSGVVDAGGGRVVTWSAGGRTVFVLDVESSGGEGVGSELVCESTSAIGGVVVCGGDVVVWGVDGSVEAWACDGSGRVAALRSGCGEIGGVCVVGDSEWVVAWDVAGVVWAWRVAGGSYGEAAVMFADGGQRMHSVDAGVRDASGDVLDVVCTWEEGGAAELFAVAAHVERSAPPFAVVGDGCDVVVGTAAGELVVWESGRETPSSSVRVGGATGSVVGVVGVGASVVAWDGAGHAVVWDGAGDAVALELPEGVGDVVDAFEVAGSSTMAVLTAADFVVEMEQLDDGSGWVVGRVSRSSDEGAPRLQARRRRWGVADVRGRRQRVAVVDDGVAVAVVSAHAPPVIVATCPDGCAGDGIGGWWPPGCGAWLPEH